MNGDGALKSLAYAGGDWVIYLLVALSVLTVAVIIERFLIQKKERLALASLKERIRPFLEREDWTAASKAARESASSPGRILSAALTHMGEGAAAVEERVEAVRILEKKELDRRLIILGTLGNNAPFIGLFGTVLGVIKAFHDLAETSSAGPEVVMQGLSEALIATAVGLLVAIPAVMAYNYFQKRVGDLLTETDAMVRLILARLKARG